MNAAQYSRVLHRIVQQATLRIEKMDPDVLSQKPGPGKWSGKEILGHLIDSAYNNHQRFLRAGSQTKLVFSGYDQDEWVRRNAYQSRELSEILDLWKRSNEHLSALIRNIKDDVLNRQTVDHNFHQICMKQLDEGQPMTLSNLIWDYIFHLEHHLAQILPNYDRLQADLA